MVLSLRRTILSDGTNQENYLIDRSRPSVPH
jgi:hypothetical protein